MSTINETTIHTGIVLGTAVSTGTYTSPLTITSSGTIVASSGNAISGPNTNAWTVVNQGKVLAKTGYGIRFESSGSVGNTGTGLIQGYQGGVYIVGSAGTVTNSGTIVATGTSALGTGTLTSDDGVALLAGGVVSNSGAIQGAYVGVFVANQAGTVVNSGKIISVTAFSYGVILDAGGNVTNQAGGNIFGGVGIENGVGTVANSGSINDPAVDGNGVFLENGGYVHNAAGLIEGYASGIVFGTAGTVGTVSNTGTIITTGTLSTNVTLGDGVYLGAGGSVANTVTAGLIEGYNNGVNINNAAGTVTNSGTIEGTGVVLSNGVELVDGGSITNNTGGLIEGYAAGVFASGVGTVTDSGTITITGTSGDGVLLSAGGSVGNTGLIEGYPGIAVETAAGVVSNSGIITGIGTGTAALGIDLAAGGTVIDSGTISGGSGTAISFGGAGGNLLTLEHGYKLTGGVAGSGTAGATNTLELAGSVGVGVTVGYNALGLANFRDALFGPGGNDTLKITNTTGTLPVTISGFTLTSDIVDLTALSNGTLKNGGTVNAGDQLIVSNGSQTVTLQLDGSDGTKFTSVHGTFGTEVMPCFCSGTKVLTPAGEVDIETLAPGDLVITATGCVAPIRWIGRRVVSRLFADPLRVLPIRITAGALDENVPSRDLLVSPDHAVLIDDILVHAGALVNGGSIRREANVPETFTYYHIELADHDLILAENTPAETFIDNVDRMAFDNWEEHQVLTGGDDAALVEMEYPRAKAHRQVPLAMRARLIDRAASLQRLPCVA